MTTNMRHVSFQHSHTIGRAEVFGAGFLNPVAVARGEGDLMYVLNRAYEHYPEGMRVTICTVGEDLVSEFAQGVSGTVPREITPADGSLVWPTSIVLDSKWNVYVADEWVNRICIFTKEGDWIRKWGTPGDGDGELNGPSGLAFDKDDNLYLVDSLSNRIQKFTKDGKFLGKWGRAGSGEGEFNMPWGIDVDSEGGVYVADWRNDRIQKFTSEGQFLMEFGGSGTGDGEFNRPNNVAVDKDGIIYVTDWMNHRLQVFAADGSFITKLAGDATISRWGKDKLDANSEMWEQRERAPRLEREKLFWGPTDVEVDDEGRIFVLESGRSRIQVYRKQAPTFVGPRL